MKKPLRMVLVSWEDASVDPDTWVGKDDTVKVVMHEQVGWLLELTPRHLLMTCTVSEDMLGSRTRIPRGMVHKITYLKVA